MSQASGGEYPRYDRVRAEFDDAFSRFRAFVARENLGPLCPNQWELTYVNQILKGGLWNSPEGWGRIFRHPEILAVRLGDVSVETFSLNWHGEIRPKRGRLHIDVQHGKLVLPDGSPNGPETVTLTLTSRGPANSDSELNEGLNCGHDAIIAAFRDLTSETAQAHWGLTDANS
jgi:uncharacterized protein (TIGR04255 family)